MAGQERWAAALARVGSLSAEKQLKRTICSCVRLYPRLPTRQDGVPCCSRSSRTRTRICRRS